MFIHVIQITYMCDALLTVLNTYHIRTKWLKAMRYYPIPQNKKSIQMINWLMLTAYVRIDILDITSIQILCTICCNVYFVKYSKTRQLIITPSGSNAYYLLKSRSTFKVKDFTPWKLKWYNENRKYLVLHV